MIINFTSFTCIPCKKEIPELELIEEKFRGKVKLWIVYTDSDSRKIEESAAEIGIRNTVCVDPLKSVALKFNVSNIPATIVIDKNNNIRAVITGYSAENIARLSEFIKNY